MSTRSANRVSFRQMLPMARVKRFGARLEQLDLGGVEADRDRAIDFQHEPCPTGRPPPALAGSIAVPRAVHPQVGTQLEAAVEPDQQVLALRLDRVNPLPDDTLDLRDRPGSLGVGREHVPADEVGTEASRRSEERVAFRHC